MGEDPETSTLRESYTEMTEVLLPNDTNTLGRALGGAVLHWMDMCGAIAAGRFANEQVVTASLDHVDFISPIDLGEIAVLEAYVFDTGRTSMDVWVEVHAENPRTDEDRTTTSSFLTFVAIDGSGDPTPVPELVCETDAEAELREHAREQRRKQLEMLRERLEQKGDD
jgi:acyl-CoA hydrolase